MYKPADENTLVTCNISCNSLGALLGVIIGNGVETEGMEEVIRQSGIQMKKQGIIDIEDGKLIETGDNNKPVPFSIPVWGIVEVTAQLNNISETDPDVYAECPTADWSPFVEKAVRLTIEIDGNTQTFDASLN